MGGRADIQAIDAPHRSALPERCRTDQVAGANRRSSRTAIIRLSRSRCCSIKDRTALASPRAALPSNTSISELVAELAFMIGNAFCIANKILGNVDSGGCDDCLQALCELVTEKSRRGYVTIRRIAHRSKERKSSLTRGVVGDSRSLTMLSYQRLADGGRCLFVRDRHAIEPVKTFRIGSSPVYSARETKN